MAVMRRCAVANGLHRCQLPEGHDGLHYAVVGAGSVSWTTPSPEWIAGLARYAYPGEPEYDTALERLRALNA